MHHGSPASRGRLLSHFILPSSYVEGEISCGCCVRKPSCVSHCTIPEVAKHGAWAGSEIGHMCLMGACPLGCDGTKENSLMLVTEAILLSIGGPLANSLLRGLPAEVNRGIRDCP